MRNWLQESKARSIHGRYQQLPSKLDALRWPKISSARSLLASMPSPVKSSRARYAVSVWRFWLQPLTSCWPNCLTVQAEICKAGWSQNEFLSEGAIHFTDCQMRSYVWLYVPAPTTSDSSL